MFTDQKGLRFGSLKQQLLTIHVQSSVTGLASEAWLSWTQHETLKLMPFINEDSYATMHLYNMQKQHQRMGLNKLYLARNSDRYFLI